MQPGFAAILPRPGSVRTCPDASAAGWFSGASPAARNIVTATVVRGAAGGVDSEIGVAPVQGRALGMDIHKALAGIAGDAPQGRRRHPPLQCGQVDLEVDHRARPP